ncbi:MAG: helix-turn-helix transcriptional regulator [Candidatus Sericytochromatia bacterium]|nr:helix-turn-helix transcriptional regulator [Candidatus Sericytochromatia bacterium]
MNINPDEFHLTHDILGFRWPAKANRNCAIFRQYIMMHYRTGDPNHPRYEIDNEPGIIDRWFDYVPYYEWAVIATKDMKQPIIFKYDDTKPYSPDNCYFVEKSDRIPSTSKVIEYMGKEYEWYEFLRFARVQSTTLRNYVYNGEYLPDAIYKIKHVYARRGPYGPHGGPGSIKGKEVEDLIQEAGMTQAEMGRALGVTMQCVNRWCRGHNYCSEKNIEKIKEIIRERSN